LVLLEQAIRATAEAILDAGGPDAVAAIAGPWADGLRELVEAFEFLVEVESVGLWSVVRTDIDARTIATKCLAAGVQVAVTGETSLLTAPPITLTPSQALDALAKIRDGLEMLERETIES
jgi:acetylornithine/succinyldiaminopimelate/putrescine aminotransferase